MKTIYQHLLVLASLRTSPAVQPRKTIHTRSGVWIENSVLEEFHANRGSQQITGGTQTEKQCVRANLVWRLAGRWSGMVDENDEKYDGNCGDAVSQSLRPRSAVPKVFELAMHCYQGKSNQMMVTMIRP